MVARGGRRRYDSGMSDATIDNADPVGAQVRVDMANIENLRRYWTVGPGAARIRWGTDGDLTRCHDLVMREAGGDLTSDQAWGFCNNLHKRLFGVPNQPD
jgi:hypothetical protein